MARPYVRLVVFSLAALAATAVTLQGLMLYRDRDRESNFYVFNADLSDPGHLDTLERDLQRSDTSQEKLGFGFSIHRLKAGHGTVLAYRQFSGGSSAIDDETYEKLTIWLRDPVKLPATQSVRFPDQGLMVLSTGGSAWPSNDCSGYVIGVVDINPLGSSIDVRIEGTFEPHGNRDLRHYCNSRKVKLHFQAEQANLDDLTPWQGSGAKHPYEETYSP